MTCMAGLVALLLRGPSGGQPAPEDSVAPAPSGLSFQFVDEATPTGQAVSWRTFWVLCWLPYDGASSYEVRTLPISGEGATASPIDLPDRCFRIEAAAGTSEPGAVIRDRAQLLAAKQRQLAVQVRAVVGAGRTDWSEPIAVGSGS